MTRPRLVLVVEDEPAIREVMTLLFECEGFAVEAAANGQDAVDHSRRHLPDVIVLDLMMPVMNGWEFIKFVATDARLRHVPILVMSAGYISADVKGLDGHPFLAKPFDIDALLGAVERVAPASAS
jgi:CheY-like chemotaxis protein